MSLAIDRVNAVRVTDPRVEVITNPDFMVHQGGSQTTMRTFTTTSISSSSVQFSCIPPSANTFIDRNINFYLPVRLTFTGNPGAGNRLLRSGFDAPRAFPVSGSIDTLSATINGCTCSINLADVVHPLMRYQTMDLEEHEFSTSPCYPDQSQTYDTLIGTNLNPLGDLSTTPDGVNRARGSSQFVVVANPAAVGAETVTATVDVGFSEKLLLSPFFFGPNSKSDNAFYNVTSMDFNINFVAQLANRLWSHSTATGGVAFASVSAALGGTAGGPTSFSTSTGNLPLMMLNYITPRETQFIGPQTVISYPYNRVERYENVQAAQAAGVSATQVANNIQLSGIPRKIYIFSRRRTADQYSSTSNTDTYLSIENLSLQFQNRSGLFSSANKMQLYNMSVKNGLTDSWEQFRGTSVLNLAQVGTVGSVICIDVVEDIGLSADEAPSVAGAQINLQVNALCTNTSGASITPSLFVVPVYDGIFSIDGLGMASTNENVLTKVDVLRAQEMPSLTKNDLDPVFGGSFLGKLGKIAKGAFNFIKDNKLLSKGLQLIPGAYGQTGAKVAQAIGLGCDDMYGLNAGAVAGVNAGVVAGVCSTKSGRKPKTAGAVMSRNMLASRLLQ